ncbi:phage major capsid protein [Pseudovibrio sp. Ad26]|uniref:phage major capsid protein n=1 Tax=Pseudovibrio sp. Ad26 TaxID=989410 RepID=UPI0007AEAA07|nr:phage major capsid protein [Pseudovibrio sp. Ad26]KZK99155.1 Phage capsid family protein [Pseudovibrio sp. Ad26]
MSKLKELREKMARIATNARAKLDEIKDDTTEERAAEIEGEFDTMMADHAKLEKQAEREEKLEKAERSANAGDERRPHGDGDEGRGVDENEPVTYRSAFGEMLRSAGDLSALPQEVREVLRQGIAEFRAQSTATGAAGGFTVPEELESGLIQAMADFGPMYDEDICTVLTTTGGNPIPMPTIDDTDKSGDAHTEGGEPKDDGSGDIEFGRFTLNAYAFNTPFVKFSLELAQDSILAMETLIKTLLGERLGVIANRQLTLGAGGGGVAGIVPAAPLGKETASNAAITSDEILEFIHSVNPAYRRSPKARAMFNDNTLLAVRKLKDGQGNYLITEAPDGTGRLRVGAVSVPYSVNQEMQSIQANAKPMLFGDFSKYYVRKVGSPILGVMKERFWPNVGIAGLIRFDGGLGDERAIKHLAMPG